ncbi:hypothetical protein BN1048_02068 [Jeotgalicoccus saudimassiliensis]|uniref:Uncharacterized protein n=1 Tax=Jeotgalicoccus saudimassiliensis TaxID=1461582 RepID=A0A078MB07_9STAP|nr:hypothetical protein [Jeotgalicoccus saudimassiliensis]CEA03394.1 hypothetical protein BN1048_02068 [Jeotgalicoccus saudimassiliensis]
MSDSSVSKEFEKALVNGYIEMAEINLLIAREGFYAESEAYRTGISVTEREFAACNDSKDGE